MRVALTILISSVICERIISSMRRLKNWLQSNILQQLFTNLSIINIEKYLTNDIFPEKILSTFTNVGRKLCLTLKILECNIIKYYAKKRIVLNFFYKNDLRK